MLPYAVFDLHCDTLTPCMHPGRSGDTLNDPGAALSLSALPREVRWAQCFAVFVPDELTGQGADTYYAQWQASFRRQMETFSHLALPCRTAGEVEAAWAAGKTAAILTVENGSALAGRPERVAVLARDGVKMMTLTWNGVNELGSGGATDQGLTPFGREAVRLMEEAGILVDVSHLNDRGLSDLLETARKPFVASHSNARVLCPHRRNLTDDQLRELFARGCLVGLNYYDRFLREGGGARPDDLLRHIEHMLELGGEDHLALGSDFDGADIPPWLDSPRKALSIYGLLLERGYSARLCDKIFYRNALRFFRQNL